MLVKYIVVFCPCRAMKRYLTEKRNENSPARFCVALQHFVNVNDALVMLKQSFQKFLLSQPIA